MSAVRSLGVVPSLLTLLVATGVQLLHAADAPLVVMEPASATHVAARKPERARWSWNQADATITATGDLAWKPNAFVYAPGKVVRYIDFEKGSDAGDGSKQSQKR